MSVGSGRTNIIVDGDGNGNGNGNGNDSDTTDEKHSYELESEIEPDTESDSEIESLDKTRTVLPAVSMKMDLEVIRRLRTAVSTKLSDAVALSGVPISVAQSTTVTSALSIASTSITQETPTIRETPSAFAMTVTDLVATSLDTTQLSVTNDAVYTDTSEVCLSVPTPAVLFDTDWFTNDVAPQQQTPPPPSSSAMLQTVDSIVSSNVASEPSVGFDTNLYLGLDIDLDLMAAITGFDVSEQNATNTDKDDASGGGTESWIEELANFLPSPDNTPVPETTVPGLFNGSKTNIGVTLADTTAAAAAAVAAAKASVTTTTITDIDDDDDAADDDMPLDRLYESIRRLDSSIDRLIVVPSVSTTRTDMLAIRKFKIAMSSRPLSPLHILSKITALTTLPTDVTVADIITRIVTDTTYRSSSCKSDCVTIPYFASPFTHRPYNNDKGNENSDGDSDDDSSDAGNENCDGDCDGAGADDGVNAPTNGGDSLNYDSAAITVADSDVLRNVLLDGYLGGVGRGRGRRTGSAGTRNIDVYKDGASASTSNATWDATPSEVTVELFAYNITSALLTIIGIVYDTACTLRAADEAGMAFADLRYTANVVDAATISGDKWARKAVRELLILSRDIASALDCLFAARCANTTAVSAAALAYHVADMERRCTLCLYLIRNAKLACGHVFS